MVSVSMMVVDDFAAWMNIPILIGGYSIMYNGVIPLRLMFIGRQLVNVVSSLHGLSFNILVIWGLGGITHESNDNEY